MFDPGVIYLIEGVNVDRTYNALTLSQCYHQDFGRLTVYFEKEPGSHRYTIKTTEPLLPFRPALPITRDFFLTPDRSIDPPSSRLLAIHRACAIILSLSGAGEYIDKILRDMEELTVRSDGTTELGSIISLKLSQQAEQVPPRSTVYRETP